VNPLISILMPVFNNASTLTTAVQSILGQTFTDWELLIIDDGSTDGTPALAREFRDPRIRLIIDGTGNKGLSARLNQGVDCARGRFVARMDGDDISYPERLQRQSEFLIAHPEVDLLGCGMAIFRGDGELVGMQPARRTHHQICGSPWRSCLLPHATWMGKAGWFRANRYDASRTRAEDRELLLRTRFSSCFAGIPEPMYGYRVDKVSIRKNSIARFTYLRALLSDGVRRHQWLRCMVAVAAESAKCVLDTFALLTRTERILLAHRAPATRDTSRIRNWQNVWASLACNRMENY
jgi:glycosyltransferase involved in cell wall biosynthesis